MAAGSFLALLLAACAGPGLREERIEIAPTHSWEPAANGPLAKLAMAFGDDQEEGVSGFQLLDTSRAGLETRLALIDSAVSSVDIMTYLWYPDESGRLLLERAVRAANRGVRVRMVVDDLLTIGLDELLADLESQENIEFRIFNPWEDRGLLARAGEMIAKFERMNSRMHNKMIVADGHAVVFGGRNLGDHYFGLSDAYNFHDLDVLGVGPVAGQAAVVFDDFWNGPWVESAANLATDPDPARARESWEALVEKNASSGKLAAIGVAPRPWDAELAALLPELHPGRSMVVNDEAEEGEIEQRMVGAMRSFLATANSELLITNAYIILEDPGIELLQDLGGRGVDVRILTNSLESHDVPAVNSHYRGTRKDILATGTRLFELRADAAIKEPVVEIEGIDAGFVGLHTKSAVVDRRYAFIGSMNFDPRSGAINTEMGVFIDSPPLAEALAEIMLRDMDGENAWQVLEDEDGDLYWRHADRTVDSQPARDAGQRIMDVIFEVFPKEQY